MSHRATSSLQQQTQGVWQNASNASVNAAAILDNHLLNELFDRGPPSTLNNNSESALQIQQQSNFIQHSSSPQTRGSKSHRYMTRQTQQLDPNLSNNGLPSVPPPVFRPIPFYDKTCILIPSTTMQSFGIKGTMNESLITFKLTVDQADFVAMASDRVNIILRFCHIDPDSSEQDDNFPPDVTITVNTELVNLPQAISNPNRPNQPPKRPGQHVDITKYCRLCPWVQNEISVKWYIDPTEPHRMYATTIIIGERVSSIDLLNRIKERGLSDPEETKKLILDSDSEVATTNLQCSLMCPLGKMKMITPCKSSKCHHIPCFDASVYLQMNEKKATWICPVCYKPAYYPDLVIDGFFSEIIQKTEPNVTDVNLNLDGSWAPVLKMEQQFAASKNNPQPEIITISSDEE